MKIETKYEIGDEVYTMFDNKIETRTIGKAFIRIFRDAYDISYEFIERDSKYEKDIFKTKEELIQSL